MSIQSYLLFKLNHSCYGIPAPAVQELFFLPEVTVLAEAPTGVLGVLNLRGELLPVVDLCSQLGRSRPPLQLTDSMIVLEWQTQRMGMIVSQVDAVQAIAAEQITASLYGQPAEHSQNGLAIGIATLEENIVTLLNPDLFVQSLMQSVALAGFSSNSLSSNSSSPNSQNHSLHHLQKYPVSSASGQGLYDHFDAAARQILRERTAALQRTVAAQDAAGLLPLAVVGLGGEYFGFDLETVHEFTEIHKITPVPCCPPHIVGNINLRGEIVTLVNISSVIDLPTNEARSHPQAVVVRSNQRVAGIAVDDIFDVTYIHPSQITMPPIAMHAAKEGYLQGIAPYQNQMISIINLSRLLDSEILIVNEEV